MSAAALALCTAPLGIGSASATGTTVYVDNGSGSSADQNCLDAISAGHLTIQQGIDAASSGDTVVVCPGVYTENANDNGKSLTIQSRSATVDGNGGSAFNLTGDGTNLDGFTLTGATSGADTPAALLQGNNESVVNTDFTGNSSAAIITGDAANFAGNTVNSPNGSSAAGFFFNSGGGSGSTVDGNTFNGDFGNAAVNIADSDPSHVAANLSVSNNTLTEPGANGGNFVVAGGTRGLTMRGNTVNGASGSGTGILLLGDDSSYSVTGNRISGLGASAVSLTGGFSYSDNGGGDISMNAFKNNIRGINVNAATAGTITTQLNILVGNSEAGIKNSTTAIVSASNNFFGCNGGPGATGCDTVAGSVNASPFLVLSTSVANPTLASGGTTMLTADLNHNNAGDTVTGHVLNGVENATFTFDGGSVDPASAPVADGAATTSLKAGTKPGTYTATAKVEQAISSKTVTVSGGTSGGGKPSLKVIDANTIEGNSGTHAITFPVRLSKASTMDVTVRYRTADGSAKAGSDYVATTGTLTIAAGKTSGIISVLVNGDTVREPSESFFVTLSQATGATIADPNASGIIKNDD